MKKTWFIFLVAATVAFSAASTAMARGYSLKKSKERAKRSGEHYRLCLVSAELRDKKLLTGVTLPDGLEEVYPDVGQGGVPWDIKAGPFSEDTDAKQLALIGVKYAAVATVPAVVGGGLIGFAAKQAVKKIPTGPDNEVEPDALGELRLGRTLMLRTDRVSGSTAPTWNHCADFKRKQLVGRRVEVRVIDYDVVRLDPLAIANGEGRLRGDVAGIVEGPEIATDMLDRVRAGKAIEQTLTVEGDSNLRSVTWRLEPVVSSNQDARRRQR